MKVAIVGAGVSGLVAAYRLQHTADVEIFEANSQVGGHVDTHEIQTPSGTVSADSGFIVFNPKHYPVFTKILSELNVAYQPTDMSFGVKDNAKNIEYNATSLSTLFCQWRNILRPSFIKMVLDIVKFYKIAPELLSSNSTVSLRDYLAKHQFSSMFIEQHIYPMACALWSCSPEVVVEFPARYLVAFMNNHDMLTLGKRPTWHTVTGGSNTYVKKLLENTHATVHTSSAVQNVSQTNSKYTLTTVNGTHDNFDHVIFACHADQALAMIDSPTVQENDVLGNIRFSKNTVTIHCDESVMPKRKKAWASWSVEVNDTMSKQCTVTYWMNKLQRLDCDTPILVSLNLDAQISTEKVWKKREYMHPIYDEKSVKAIAQHGDINGQNNRWFCGAYWGWGFHEDGARSGQLIAEAIIEGAK